MLRCYDRHTLVPCSDHAWNEVGRTRSWIAKYRCNLPCCLIQPFRHVNAGRLVAAANESDAVFVKLGEHCVDFRARRTENELDSFVGQTSDQELSTVNFCHRSLSSISLSTADTYS